jgi:hypothetical protein
VTGFWLNHVRKPYTCITPHLRTISINQANQHRSRASSRRRYDPGLVLWQWMENHSAASGTDPVSLEHFRRPHGPGNQHQDHARTSEKPRQHWAERPSGELSPAAVLNSAPTRES